MKHYSICHLAEVKHETKPGQGIEIIHLTVCKECGKEADTFIGTLEQAKKYKAELKKG